MPWRLLLVLLACSLACLLAACGQQDDAPAQSGAGSGQTDDDDSSPAAAADDDDNDDDNDDTTPGRADITLPPYPFWPNDAFVVDEAFMEELATAYCAQAADPTAQTFFMGELPMDSFDLVYAAAPPAGPETLMGDLYISGYFGGLWLRDVLNFTAREANDDFDLLHLPFELLARFVAKQLALAGDGNDADVLDAAHGQIFMLLALYGYNLGYLQQIIAHPPAGIDPPTDKLACQEGQLLDCDSPGLTWPFLQRYAAAIAKLRNPPNDAWAQLATMTENADVFVQQGENVWQLISLENLDAEGYALLIDLSVYFLMASKAAVLGGMTAWADVVPAEGRDALAVSGGMMTWGGSYFMGLMSPAPSDQFPELVCP